MKPAARSDSPLSPAAAATTPAPWRAARLLDAPHRLCFFWAGLNWAGAAAWWAAYLVATSLGLAWPWQLPPAAAHGLWFSLGAMPLFIAGFMFTAGPKWLRRPAVDARTLRTPVTLFSLGWALAVAGFHLGLALAAAGLSLVALGWGLLSWRILRLIAGSEQADRRHPRLIAVASLIMLSCMVLSALALAVGSTALLQPVLRVGLWGGVSLVFLVVSHRMLPFLGTGSWSWLDARWPDWPLWLVVSVPLLQSASALLEPWRAALPVWAGFQAAYLAGVAALCLWIALRWTREPAVKQSLVAMLLGALLWWDLALWLAAAAHWPGLASGNVRALDLAAVHALTMGFLGGTLLVMASRISSTHSGRPVAIDRVARWLYALLQLAVVLRLAAAVAPALAPKTAGLLLPAAALLWLAVTLAWALRHGRWLGSPRADGRPG